MREDEDPDKEVIFNAKAKKVNKWDWVPFYNLALLGDYDSSLKQYEEKASRLKDQIRSDQIH